MRVLVICLLFAGVPSTTSAQASRSAAPPAVETIENSIGMKLVRIEAGEFDMGETYNKSEQPIHRVRITKPFYMGQTEVTQRQWRDVMGTSPWASEEYVKKEQVEYVKKGDAMPAIFVSWEDAVEFCKRLTESELAAGRLLGNQRYRLPTEAEWEYACRAGTETRWSFGNDERQLGDHAWWGGYFNGNAMSEKYAHEVGKKKPNSWMLFDMHGNVAEWCSDWYDDNYYKQSPVADPKGPSSDGSFRVFRGGNWGKFPEDSRSACRHTGRPNHRTLYVGFRVVGELE